jgi:hypothetical protein
MRKIPREVELGVWYLGKEREDNRGSNVYLNTHETMGTYGDPPESLNYRGVIMTGRRNNPNGYMAINYALSEKSYLREQIKDVIRQILRV